VTNGLDILSEAKLDSARFRIRQGRIDGEYFRSGMVITFEEPCRDLAPGDMLAIKSTSGVELEISLAALRPDGKPSVWYAPHPLLRHWLGWLERNDDRHWSFFMEPYHVDILDGIPELGGRAPVTDAVRSD
jgi:hypothetical protein